MQSLFARLPMASFVLLAGYLVITALRVGNDTTTQMVLSSIAMFAFSWVKTPWAGMHFVFLKLKTTQPFLNRLKPIP